MEGTQWDGPTLRLTLEESEAGESWPAESHVLGAVTKKNEGIGSELGRLCARMIHSSIYPGNEDASGGVDAFIEEAQTLDGDQDLIRAYYATHLALQRWIAKGGDEDELEEFLEMVNGSNKTQKKS